MTLQQVDYLKTNTGGATIDTIVVEYVRVECRSSNHG